MEVLLTRAPSGALIPINDDEASKMTRFKTGDTIRGEFTVMRNGAMHRKAFSLLQLCYEKFCDNVAPAEYKGVAAAPDFDLWREQFTILAGHYTVAFDIRGRIKLKAKSLSFAKCNQVEFEEIYSSLINAALKHVYADTMTERELRDLVEQILRYA
jgi:Protein of unknown function (DUF1367)